MCCHTLYIKFVYHPICSSNLGSVAHKVFFLYLLSRSEISCNLSPHFLFSFMLWHWHTEVALLLPFLSLWSSLFSCCMIRLEFINTFVTNCIAGCVNSWDFHHSQLQDSHLYSHVIVSFSVRWLQNAVTFSFQYSCQLHVEVTRILFLILRKNSVPNTIS
jgi:hypothetical protein